MTIGLGTLAYGIAAGMALAVAQYSGAIALRRRTADRLFTIFALLGAFGAVGSVLTLVLHKASSVDEYARYFKLFGFVSLLALATMVALVAAWTRAAPRWALIVFAAGTVVIGCLHLALPTGLLAGQITALRDVQFFGESFAMHVAEPSSWRWVLDVYLIVTTVLVVAALTRGRRRVDSNALESVLFAGSVVLMIAAGVVDTLIDLGVVDTTYLTWFGVVSFVAAGSMLIAREMERARSRLQHQAADLERTVVERTAALHRANDKLHRQLSHQRTTVRRLERLARQFEEMNKLALGPLAEDELARSLKSMLEQLGRLLHVDAIELHPSGDLSGQVPRGVAWRAERRGEPAGEAEPPGDAAAAGLEITERIAIGQRRLGRLVIRPPRAEAYGAEERRVVDLAVEQLAGFLHRLELRDQIATSAVQGERSRIARELHDSITQQLYGATFLADAVPRMQESQPDQVVGVVRRMREIILSSLAELRVMLFELRPKMLDAEDLPELIERLAQTVVTGPPMKVTATAEPVPHLPKDVALGFYRIAQEAMSNAVRHSGSSTIGVTLHHVDGVTRLAVSDAGVGFDPTRGRTGHGLTGLRERAAQLGAELEIRSAPGVGTDLVVQWPGDTTAEPPTDPRGDPVNADPDHLAGRGAT